MVIWMDGRHPSRALPHSPGGFTTGTWDGDVLTAYTTHDERLSSPRGATSDQATMRRTLYVTEIC